MIPVRKLRALSPYRCTFGYDVLVYVGRALFVERYTERQIIAALGRKNVSLSAREISFLGKKFILYLAQAHRQSRQRLKQAMALRGGYILHLDGTCKADSPQLFTGIDSIAHIVLDNIKLPSEKGELLIPFIRRIKCQYGDPIGEDERSVRRLAAGIDSGRMDPLALPKAPVLGAYALMHWCLDTSTLDGYGFPFDRPHLGFYRGLKHLHGLIDKQHIRCKVKKV